MECAFLCFLCRKYKTGKILKFVTFLMGFWERDDKETIRESLVNDRESVGKGKILKKK